MELTFSEVCESIKSYPQKVLYWEQHNIIPSREGGKVSLEWMRSLGDHLRKRGPLPQPFLALIARAEAEAEAETIPHPGPNELTKFLTDKNLKKRELDGEELRWKENYRKELVDLKEKFMAIKKWLDEKDIVEVVHNVNRATSLLDLLGVEVGDVQRIFQVLGALVGRTRKKIAELKENARARVAELGLWGALGVGKGEKLQARALGTPGTISEVVFQSSSDGSCKQTPEFSFYIRNEWVDLPRSLPDKRDSQQRGSFVEDLHLLRMSDGLEFRVVKGEPHPVSLYDEQVANLQREAQAKVKVDRLLDQILNEKNP